MQTETIFGLLAVAYGGGVSTGLVIAAVIITRLDKKHAGTKQAPAPAGRPAIARKFVPSKN